MSMPRAEGEQHGSHGLLSQAEWLVKLLGAGARAVVLCVVTVLCGIFVGVDTGHTRLLLGLTAAGGAAAWLYVAGKQDEVIGVLEKVKRVVDRGRGEDAEGKRKKREEVKGFLRDIVDVALQPVVAFLWAAPVVLVVCAVAFHASGHRTGQYVCVVVAGLVGCFGLIPYLLGRAALSMLFDRYANALIDEFQEGESAALV